MMALSQTLHITLLDDCVFSEGSATEGAHATLHRVPGSALLGAAAAQLYPQLTAPEADAAFHSGRLRFGDGLPLCGETPAWPMPMCWHYAKGHKPISSPIEAALVHNFLHVSSIPKAADKQDGEESEQPRQMRDGYITATGHLVELKSTYRMKTAISAETGRAADAQLFGYSALQRGQTFITRIEADADFDPHLFERITGVFRGQILLGRSRSAEYGRVHIAHAAPAAAHVPQPGAVDGKTLTLWLLSDLAPCDAFGQATLALDPHALGFPAGSRIVWDKTFTRARRYSPWNAKRHGFDAERQVLMAGGVITLELPSEQEARQCAVLLQHGIGLHREAGLGQVWVNPPLLVTVHPQFAAPGAATAAAASAAPRPDHPLLHWIDARQGTSRENIENRAQSIAAQYHAAIDRAHKALGYPDYATDFYPSRSQWGSVLEAARTRNDAELYRALFQGGDAVIKPQGKGWGLQIPPQSTSGGTMTRWMSLSDWLKQELGQQETCDASLVRQLARLLMDHPAKRKA